METIKITHHFPIDPAQLFPYIAEQRHVKHWWGSQDTLLDEFKLDFTRTGEWFATLVTYKTGKAFTASGTVSEVLPNERIRFTWAWHDHSGQRQQESEVSLVLTPIRDQADNTLFTVAHHQLVNKSIAKSHQQGWEEALEKLVTYFSGRPDYPRTHRYRK